MKLKACINILMSLLLVALLLPVSAVVATEGDEGQTADVSRQELLDQQGYLVWQKINDARQNPLATAERLEVSLETVQAVFGDDFESLAQGLTPLAWDQLLFTSARGHGQDIFTRFFYSSINPDGLGPVERAFEQGYRTLIADETLAALVFSNFVDVEKAVGFMLDTMLRDELSGTPGVPRNIFSTEYSEVGISFFAESVELLENAPYIYLFVLDFAKPIETRRFLIGQVAPETRVLMKRFGSNLWFYQPFIQPGLFQVVFPEGGAELVLVGDADSLQLSEQVSIADPGNFDNQLIDLREVEMFDLVGN